MNKVNSPMDRIKIGLGIALLVVVMGCMSDGGGYYYGGPVVVAPDPDLYLFGGGYERGRDVHDYSNRGSASRAAAHPSVSSAARSGGGGARGGKR